MALAAVLAVYPALSSRWTLALGVVGVVAVLLYLAALLAPWPAGMAPAVALLAIEYLLSVLLKGQILDVVAPAYGAALFICAELGWLASERQGVGGWLPGGAAIAGTALGAAALGWLVLETSALPLAGSLAITAVGVAAAVAVAAGLGWLASRVRGGEEPDSPGQS
ncbi:MAG: hypothetical protein J2P45_08510 [Candidatus Dormibacteraeota bacterium]|nr:hypothetical protein [Candidatus Dormibacteraeota bacterium]